MENDKKQSARHLYAQTDLNKSQIASMLGIHRHTLSIWVREGDWDRLKNAGNNLPSILAEKVYLMIGHLTDYHLSERRMTDPISHKEADTIYKLALTVAKLRTRSALNESMEMMGHLLQRVQKKDNDLATRLSPHIDEYLSEKAHIHTEHLMPEGYTAPGGRIPVPTLQEEAEQKKEAYTDRQEAFYSDPETIALYQECGIPIPPEYNSELHVLSPQTPHTHSHTPTPHPRSHPTSSPWGRPGGATLRSHPTPSPWGRPGGAAHAQTPPPAPRKRPFHKRKPSSHAHQGAGRKVEGRCTKNVRFSPADYPQSIDNQQIVENKKSTATSPPHSPSSGTADQHFCTPGAALSPAPFEKKLSAPSL